VHVKLDRKNFLATTGAAAAGLVSTVVFCAIWSVLLARLRRDRVRAEALAT